MISFVLLLAAVIAATVVLTALAQASARTLQTELLYVVLAVMTPLLETSAVLVNVVFASVLLATTLLLTVPANLETAPET